MSRRAISVILGPRIHLHPGTHGELVETPPSGVTYYSADHRHRFLFPHGSSVPLDPYRDYAVSQTVEFVLPPDRQLIVHSTRLPVFNRVPWLVDADCLLSTINHGTPYALGSGGRAPANQALVRQRQRLMLSHYLSGHCCGLLFWTDYARRRFRSFVEDRRLLSARDRARLAAKSDVLRPTMSWRGSADQRTSRPTILYMARCPQSKGGHVAVEVFRRIHARYGNRVGLVYVGQLPEDDHALPAGITYHPLLDRPAYLKILSRAHIFLSPTQYESYGFGLVEAASYGLAIVTRRGPGMEHIEELFQDGKNALLVSAQKTPVDTVNAYEQKARSLLDGERQVAVLRANNLELFRTGALSLEAHNRKLLGYYRRMLKQPFPGKCGDVPARSAMLARKHKLESCAMSDDECLRRQAEIGFTRRILV